VEASPHLPLAAWQSFYVIVGAAAAALTGLQFVAIAILAQQGVPATSREIAAFGTPTIVHFSATLFVSAILSAPWQSLWKVSIVLVLSGLAGVVYSLIVFRRTKAQMIYQPVFEDWLWFNVFPLFAYVLLLISAIFLGSRPHRALFVIAAAVFLLLVTGIHNAWDGVTYIAIERRPTSKEPEEKPDSE
jgi:hypothetical protein